MSLALYIYKVWGEVSPSPDTLDHSQSTTSLAICAEAMASKVELVVEVKSPADKLWAALRDSTELFPKIFPEQYKSIETVEGDGKSAGTVRLLKYTEGT